MNPWPWLVASAANVISNDRVFSAIIDRKCPASAPYIIQGKRMLANSVSEKLPLERFRVTLVLVGLPNSMIEGHIKKDCCGWRHMVAPIKK